MTPSGVKSESIVRGDRKMKEEDVMKEQNEETRKEADLLVF